MTDTQYQDYIRGQVNTFLQKSFYKDYVTDILDELSLQVKANNPATLQALSYLQSLISQTEIDKVKWIAESLMKKDVDIALREQIAVLGSDISHNLGLYHLIKSLEKYNSAQLLFCENSELLNQSHKHELLSSTILQREPLSSIVRLPNKKYAYIEDCLEQPILQTLTERGIEYYVRVNPHYIYNQKPTMLIKEAAWRRPSPKWENAIGIKANCKDGFSYYIPDDIDCETHPHEFMDRKLLNVFRLEGMYKRESNGYFSMMVEELKEVKHPFNNGRYVIGRMIHLDSDEDGKNGMRSKLKHIDLAINLYVDNDAETRCNEHLENGGKIVNATYRSHILRINNTTLSDIILLSAFFESKCLSDEWITEMFQIV